MRQQTKVKTLHIGQNNNDITEILLVVAGSAMSPVN
jgi:hypothetical protein